MGKMMVTQFDPRESRQTMMYKDQAVAVGGVKSWNTRLESLGKPTCEGCGKEVDAKKAVYLGPIGLPGADGKLYCGYGCVEVPKGPLPLRDRLDAAIGLAGARMELDTSPAEAREKLVEAVMETIKPIVDMLHYAARHPGLPFGGLARAEQVLRDVGLEAAEEQ